MVTVTTRIVEGLSAELIEPRLFPTRRWYYASPLWYYHAPRTSDRVRTDDQFYGLIDPEIQEICRVLQDAGLRTTPSCQGHFYPREWFEEIWSDLEADAPRIRGEGLPVTDSETGTPYLFRDPRYELPWSGFEAFHEEIRRSQVEGYLGFVVPRERGDLIRRLETMPSPSGCASIRRDTGTEAASEDGALFTLSVKPRDPHERRREWECATEAIRAVVAG